MQLTEITFDTARPIDGYGPGFFRVGGAVIEGPVLVTAQAARSWGGVDDIAALTALAGEIDVILFGSGTVMTAVPAGLVATVEAAGMGVEPMATPSACRAYNVLLSEGRRVALAALAV
ncbi:Mth938-like domain-containing protein [Maritimibacter sp. HL-12]|jgi:uncharacterized protein|uniref:Mth938-like domain-containing protein n=1 Tax=Maritimibacter sp. HL-12 TaxID=1162418 RepID=UPI000A0EEEDC|nr:Mth938-like domain-containing protein [Maritimibacter sp. HL-12]SMH31059.1 Uncharacterized conserved protein, contains Mth938-like domain [Maritimibacter sp. HL-12]